MSESRVVSLRSTFPDGSVGEVIGIRSAPGVIRALNAADVARLLAQWAKHGDPRAEHEVILEHRVTLAAQISTVSCEVKLEAGGKPL